MSRADSILDPHMQNYYSLLWKTKRNFLQNLESVRPNTNANKVGRFALRWINLNLEWTSLT